METIDRGRTPGLRNGQRLISGGALCPEGGLEAFAGRALLRGFRVWGLGYRVPGLGFRCHKGCNRV